MSCEAGVQKIFGALVLKTNIFFFFFIYFDVAILVILNNIILLLRISEKRNNLLIEIPVTPTSLPQKNSQIL